MAGHRDEPRLQSGEFLGAGQVLEDDAFCPLALGDVHERHDRPHRHAINTLGVGPIFRGKTCAVCPPNHFIIHVRAFVHLECAEYPALFDREISAIRMLVVDLPVHVLSEQFLLALISQHPQTGGVAKGALSARVDAVNGFRRGIQQELELILALIQLLGALFHPLLQLQMGLAQSALGQLALGNIQMGDDHPFF